MMDGRPYHIETSTNQWAGFYMMGTSVLKELRYSSQNLAITYKHWSGLELEVSQYLNFRNG